MHLQSEPSSCITSNFRHGFSILITNLLIEIAIWDSTCLFETTPDAPIPCNRVRSHIYPRPERSKRWGRRGADRKGTSFTRFWASVAGTGARRLQRFWSRLDALRNHRFHWDLGRAHEGGERRLNRWRLEGLRRYNGEQKSYIRVLPTVKQCLWAFVPLNMFCLFPSLKLHSDACNWVHWQAAYASVIQWRECDLECSRFIKMFFNGCRNGKFISNDFHIAWFSYLWLRTISGQLQDVSKMTVRQVPGRAHKLSGEFFVGQRLIWRRCCRDQSNYFWAAWSLGIHETPRTPRTPRSQEFEDTQMSRINESRQTLVSVRDARRCCSGRAQVSAMWVVVPLWQWQGVPESRAPVEGNLPGFWQLSTAYEFILHASK